MNTLIHERGVYLTPNVYNFAVRRCIYYNGHLPDTISGPVDAFILE